MWTREREAQLLDAVADAVATRRPPASGQEADVYRLTAQLLKTRYEDAARFLDEAARQFYARSSTTPRSFPQVVEEGLVSDVPRLRHMLEKRLSGVRSW